MLHGLTRSEKKDVDGDRNDYFLTLKKCEIIALFYGFN